MICQGMCVGPSNARCYTFSQTPCSFYKPIASCCLLEEKQFLAESWSVHRKSDRLVIREEAARGYVIQSRICPGFDWKAVLGLCLYRSCHSWSVWHVYGGSSLKWSPWVSGSHCRLENRLLFCALPRDQEVCSAWLSLKSFTNLLDVLKSIQPRRNGLSGVINYGVNCHGVIFYRILDFHFLHRVTDLCIHCVPRRAGSIWALGGIWMLASQRKRTSSSLPKIYAHVQKDGNNYNHGYWNYSCKLCFSPGLIS